MQTISNIDDLTKRLIPLTYLRRNAGEVLSRLDEVGEFVLTKDGKPVARLTSLEQVEKETIKERLARLEKVIGGFHLGRGMTPKELNKLLDKRYEEMLPG